MRAGPGLCACVRIILTVKCTFPRTERSFPDFRVRHPRRSRTRHRVKLPVERHTQCIPLSVPFTRQPQRRSQRACSYASPHSSSTFTTRQRRCRQGLTVMHIMAQLNRTSRRPAAKHTAEHTHHAQCPELCRRPRSSPPWTMQLTVVLLFARKLCACVKAEAAQCAVYAIPVEL